MRAVLLIARRELSRYLRTLSGWVIIAILLMALGFLFNAYVLNGDAHLSAEVIAAFFRLASFFVVVAGILLSMRLLAEERQTGTLNLLYSSPVRDSEIVLGKFLSAFVFLSLMVALSLYMPLLVLVHGKVSAGHLVAGYLGLLLMGAGSVAIGTFGSALAPNQVVAVISSAGMTLALALLQPLASATEPPFSRILDAMGFAMPHYLPFHSGVVHLRDVVYYLAVIYVALFAATRVLEARRWR